MQSPVLLIRDIAQSIRASPLPTIEVISNAISNWPQIENYRNFVEETENIEMNNRSNIDLRTSIIGSTSFKEKILSKVQKSTAQACAPDIKRSKTAYEIDTIIIKICAFYNIERESLMHTKRGQCNWPRTVCIYMSRKYFGHTLQAISNAFGSICYATVSANISKCQLQLEKKRQYDEIDRIYKSIIG